MLTTYYPGSKQCFRLMLSAMKVYRVNYNEFYI